MSDNLIITGNTVDGTTSGKFILDAEGETPQTDEYTRGYLRGYDVATSRAQSRHELDLPIERR